MDSTQVDILNRVPDWITAVGTLLAVIVALYLARRDRLIRCVVNTNIYVLVDPTQANHPTFVTILVTNIGTRSFVLSSISWRTGLLVRIHFVMIPAINEYSSCFPVKLSDGEQANFYFPIDDFQRTTARTILESRSKLFLPIGIRFVKITAHTTAGHSFTFKVSKPLRNLLLGKRK